MMNYGMYKYWRSYLTEKPRTRDQYGVQSFMSGFSPVHRGYYEYRDNMAYMDDYMKNRGVNWSNVKYPSRTVGWSGGASAGSSLRSVSRNVTSLYSSSKRYNNKYRADMRRAYWDGRNSR